MKTNVILSFILTLTILAFGFTPASSDSTKTIKQKKITAVKNATKVIYVCPMDADVVSSKPGDCPKCGMKLQKKTIGKEKKQTKSLNKGQNN
ncbi:MAG: heavy metal-binding domain-containing protein [Bacteroidota bacterium]